MEIKDPFSPICSDNQGSTVQVASDDTMGYSVHGYSVVLQILFCLVILISYQSCQEAMLFMLVMILLLLMCLNV